MTSSISRFDITLPVNETWPDESTVHVYLREWATKYVFQKEQGDSGYLHWQGRINLIKPRRANTLKGKFCVGGHFSITSNAAFRTKNFSYVMKADTRIGEVQTDENYKERPPLTRQLRSFLECKMYPWQTDVISQVQLYDDRSIKVIYDQVGNSGKSILCEYLEYMDLAVELPPLRGMEDIMAVVMCLPTSKAYIIDMPRGMKKDKLAEFYSGLESLKNGKVYDKRYAYKCKRFDRPQVIVMTNVLPEFSLMSKDRWECWAMSANKTLLQMPMS